MALFVLSRVGVGGEGGGGGGGEGGGGGGGGGGGYLDPFSPAQKGILALSKAL